LAGATIVQPTGLLSPGTLTVEGDRITEVAAGHRPADARDIHDHYIVPGFVDVHVHGVEGFDSLAGGDAVAAIARRLPRYGVTAFCPTSIACPPSDLRAMFSAIRAARLHPAPDAARVLPAHLESNFISAEFKGAQPETCIRRPHQSVEGSFSGRDILDEIARWRGEVGILTVAPEVDGVLALIPELISHGHRVSLGHSGATYEQGLAGVAAGARQATHLFNRMTGFGHRAPGLAGAVLDCDELVAEVICDGVHVHPASVRVAVAAKSPSRIMAITDGTAGSGLEPGSRTGLGGRPITVRDAAYLDDGTLAGSVLTMDRAFSSLITMGFTIVDAALMCSTTPARQLNLHGCGIIAPGATADFVVLDRDFAVVETYIEGIRVYVRG
ncbi:MAG TPA: N-acetylglucosamine-6-phosphate deacetylase, partial [Gemmatimonadaceae bacterium]|nr:N-acetylglucosamine-6-phosphate deacetylase [Gemmatimonadaceae bacterium]